MPSIQDLICEELTVAPEFVADALRLAHVKFKKIRVPKRSGGTRTIVQPAAELKLLHRWLDAKVLAHLPISSVATAFHPGASIVKNARTHQKSKYSIRIDFTDFFPSIRSSDLLCVVAAAASHLPPWTAGAEFQQFVRMACFDRADRLPIGYPTSPRIANAVMFGFDNLLWSLLQSSPAEYGTACLTRYADDIVFSTDKAGACKTFLGALEGLTVTTASPKLSINNAKTRFMSRAGGSTLVTGLRINQQGVVRVHPQYRDHVRLLLKHFSNGTLKPDDRQRLVGHLAHVEHADPRLFTRLSYRYFNEIARLRET